MNSKIKRIVSFSLLLIFILSVFSVASLCSSAESLEERTETVELLTGSENAEYNWIELSRSISYADENTLLTIKIDTPDTYYIGKDSTAAAIRLRPNTVLDLNGSTLIRSGKMGNMVQGCDFDDNTANGVGYTLTGNITVKNGTFDGSGGTDNDNSNIFNFGHASGITLDNLSIKNSKGGHLVEFTGCENVTVTNCRFDGYLNSDLESAVEALQLDVCTSSNTGGKSWNGVYCTDEGGADNTPCRNVVIDNCSFLNFPSGIGNHKGVKGKTTDNVTITNCYFNNTLNSAQPAIWAYNFSNSLISDNEISGSYSNGIYLSGGSNTTVSNNSIILEKTSLYVTVASASYVIGSGGTKDSEYTSECKIMNNDLTTTSDSPAVCVYSSSHISEFSGNTVIASNEKAVTITTDSKADLISNNTIISSGTTDSSYGLHLADSTIGAVKGNTITASGAHALQVSSGAKVTEISNNSIRSDSQDGIYVTASTADTISANTIVGCPVDSIAVINSSTAKTVSNNKITDSGNDAIRIAKSTVTTVSGNVINKAADCGIYVSDSSVSEVSGNYINKCTNSGIKSTSSSASVIKKVYGNAVFGSKDYGIRLNNSSVTVKIGNNAVKYNSPDGLKNNGKTSAVNKAGWLKIGSKWFYFNSDGSYKAGWQKISKKWYYFDKYGQMLTGWQKISKKWYYFNSSGVMLTGWQKISGKWYYFNSSGTMLTSWQKIGGKWYYFQSGGAMKTGWLKLSGKWYYFNSSGVMQTGTVKIGNKNYKFNSSGVCLNP